MSYTDTAIERLCLFMASDLSGVKTPVHCFFNTKNCVPHFYHQQTQKSLGDKQT